MKTIKILLLLTLASLIQSTYSQSGWFQQFTASYFKSITCINSHTGWALAQNYEDDTRIYKTYDGSNWNLVCSTFAYQSHNIAFMNEHYGIFPAQGNSYFVTVSGGIYWSLPNCVPFFYCPGPSEWSSVAFDNNGSIYMVGLAYDSNWVGHSAVVYGSVEPSSGYYFISNDNIMLNKIRVTDPNNIWFVGNSGRVIKFPAETYILNENANFTGVSFPDPSNGYVIGGSYFYKTTNGGGFWTQIASPLNGSFHDIYFVNKDTGWVTGGIPDSGGAVLRTTNGGVNWTLQWSSTSYSGIEISFANPFIGWVLCGERIIKTVTGGEPMINPPLIPRLKYPPNDTLISSTTPTLIWDDTYGATSYGVQISTDTALRTIVMDTSGVLITSIQVPGGRLLPGNTYYWRIRGNNNISNGSWSFYRHFNTLMVGTGNKPAEIPKEFKLYTNYPNPFNPTTIIKFDIPKEIYVKIIIYDVLGKVVQTLLDANIKAGKYEIEWDGSNYPSGVYFYKMETGEYTSVRKMVLLK